MIRILTVASLGLALLTSTATAQERSQLGYGRLINNDFIGDTQDRWRTGSVASSRVWGPSWNGAAPSTFGEVLEFRINAEVIAPDNLVTPAAGDRPFAGSLSFGLHSHMQKRNTQIAVGLDLVLTGPMTQLDEFQSALHDTLGVADASATTRANQIGDGVHPTFVAEVGREFSFGSSVLRPFVETRVGVETMLRVGADLTIGDVGKQELLVRDPVTGQRYRTIQKNAPGYSFVVGGDIAKVTDSVYLPSDRGYVLSESRKRVRAGFHWQGERSSTFYGISWLGEEFVGQQEGQFVGSLRLNLDF
ncbi:MAG: DUF2219 family protein [Thalassovita sp.]